MTAPSRALLAVTGGTLAAATGGTLAVSPQSPDLILTVLIQPATLLLAWLVGLVTRRR